MLELGGHSWPDPRTSTTSAPCLLTPHTRARPGPRQDFRDLLPSHLSTCGLGRQPTRRGPQRPRSPSWSSSWSTGLWSLPLCYSLPALAHPLFGRHFLKSCSCSVLGSCIRPSPASPFALSSGAPTGLGRSLLISTPPTHSVLKRLWSPAVPVLRSQAFLVRAMELRGEGSPELRAVAPAEVDLGLKGGGEDPAWALGGGVEEGEQHGFSLESV